MTEETRPRLGVYFGLPADDYHADPALGSSDIKALATDPVGWWWQSHLNPQRPSRSAKTPALVFGSALHDFILLGEEDFGKRYRKGGGAKDTVPVSAYDTLLRELGRRDFDNWDKEDKVKTIREYGWELLTNTQWRGVHVGGAMIAQNPALAQAFSNGASEVSIFWEQDGVRKKCRIDYLKQKANVDLKSVDSRGYENVSFDRMCKRAVSKDQLYVQATHYLDGRDHFIEHLQTGRIYGGDHLKQEWLEAVADHPEPDFVFVFYQKRPPHQAKAFAIRHSDKLYGYGRSEIAMAMANLEKFSEQFGDEAWVNTDPVEYLAEEDVYIPNDR